MASNQKKKKIEKKRKWRKLKAEPLWSANRRDEKEESDEGCKGEIEWNWNG